MNYKTDKNNKESVDKLIEKVPIQKWQVMISVYSVIEIVLPYMTVMYIIFFSFIRTSIIHYHPEYGSSLIQNSKLIHSV